MKTLSSYIPENGITEVDRIAKTSTQLDEFLSNLPTDSLKTIGIRIFLQLLDGPRGLDVPSLALETGLTRKSVKFAIDLLVESGRINPLEDNANKFEMSMNGANNHDQGGNNA